MSDLIAPLRAAYVNRTRHARQAHANGQRVIGYVCDNVPRELIRAAGFLPYRLSGDTARSRRQVTELITPVHARRFAGNEFIEALYAPLAAGELDFLDYLIVPHNRKAVLSLIQSVEMLHQSAPDFAIPQAHCLDRSYARTFLTSGFNQASVLKLAQTLEQWRGAPIAQDDLHAAIQAEARIRTLLRALNTLRSGHAPRVTGSEALCIYGASHFMDVEEFERHASAFIDMARQRAPLEGTRVYLGGSPLDHPQLYEAIESLGAIIVMEDHCWGARCADTELDPDVPALDALARRFDKQPACSLLGSLDAITTSVTARVRASGADVAIFNVIRGDMAQMWETPSQVDALQAMGMPCLHLARQAYNAADMAPVIDQVRTFLASATGKTLHA